MDEPLNNCSYLFEAALEIQGFFEKKSWPFCFIGGLAVLRWGEIRMTQDIDLCLECGFGKEEIYLDEIIKEFIPRISDAKNFALVSRTLLLYSSNSVSIDISLSGLNFEEEMLSRSSFFEFQKGYTLRTCSAEDLIVMKAFANRPKDWLDIDGIISNQGKKLDHQLVLENIEPLAMIKEESKIIDKLNDYFNR